MEYQNKIHPHTHADLCVLTRRAKWYYLGLMFIGFKPSFLKMGISPMKGNLGREFSAS
jgi:hypothetical protein